jgi:hypothetical protein
MAPHSVASSPPCRTKHPPRGSTEPVSARGGRQAEGAPAQFARREPLWGRRFAWRPALPWFLIGFGVVLRVAQYLSDRSLWLDEAALASTIVHRPFVELLNPPENGLVAPAGFILLEKLILESLGTSEYALRLLPLIAGVLSLFVFYSVARRVLPGAAVPVALALFALSDPLVYYASEVRQYSSDVLLTLVLFMVGLDMHDGRRSPLRLAAIALLGAAAVWFSHPTVFVMAGIAASSVLMAWRRSGRALSGRLLLTWSLWAASFVGCYLLLLREPIRNQQLVAPWKDTYDAFMPVPTSLADLAWFFNAAVQIFENPAGLYLPGLATLLFILGCVAMFRRREEHAFLLLAPLLFSLAASGLRKYPFEGRLLLFLAPSLLLFVSAGAIWLFRRVRPRSRPAAMALIIALFTYPVANAVHDLVHPRKHEEIEPVLSYLRDRQHPGDVLYLYHGARKAFDYYAQEYGFAQRPRVVGIKSKEEPRRYLEDLNRLRGKDRVWILFSHVRTNEEIDEGKLFLHHLDRIGRKRGAYRADGASVYLYDLSAHAGGEARARTQSAAGPVTPKPSARERSS